MIGTTAGTELDPELVPTETETETRHLTRPGLGCNPRLGTNARMNTSTDTGTVPRLETIGIFFRDLPGTKIHPETQTVSRSYPQRKKCPETHPCLE